MDFNRTTFDPTISFIDISGTDNDKSKLNITQCGSLNNTETSEALDTGKSIKKTMTNFCLIGLVYYKKF